VRAFGEAGGTDELEVSRCVSISADGGAILYELERPQLLHCV
jgi:hypothetical protein